MNFGRKISNPTPTLAIAIIKTAPAAKSLAFPMNGSGLSETLSASVSKELFIASALITPPIHKMIRHHSVTEILHIIPQAIAAEAAAA